MVQPGGVRHARHRHLRQCWPRHRHRTRQRYRQRGVVQKLSNTLAGRNEDPVSQRILQRAEPRQPGQSQHHGGQHYGPHHVGRFGASAPVRAEGAVLTCDWSGSFSLGRRWPPISLRFTISKLPKVTQRMLQPAPQLEDFRGSAGGSAYASGFVSPRMVLVPSAASTSNTAPVVSVAGNMRIRVAPWMPCVMWSSAVDPNAIQTPPSPPLTSAKTPPNSRSSASTCYPTSASAPTISTRACAPRFSP